MYKWGPRREIVHCISAFLFVSVLKALNWKYQDNINGKDVKIKGGIKRPRLFSKKYYNNHEPGENCPWNFDEAVWETFYLRSPAWRSMKHSIVHHQWEGFLVKPQRDNQILMYLKWYTMIHNDATSVDGIHSCYI